jgi:dsDNA-specific endonuclease/ATPase MutS2
VQLTVKESDIEFITRADLNNAKQVAAHKSPIINTEIVRSSKRKPPAAVDLHGLCVDDACRKLEDWLNQMILARMWHGKVIHGLGTGKLQLATHEVLSRYQAVRAFKINQFNRGETDVYFC